MNSIRILSYPFAILIFIVIGYFIYLASPTALAIIGVIIMLALFGCATGDGGVIPFFLILAFLGCARSIEILSTRSISAIGRIPWHPARLKSEVRALKASGWFYGRKPTAIIGLVDNVFDPDIPFGKKFGG
jgi:hypothetical protein